MSSHHISAQWQEGLHFEADVLGHALTLDVGPNVGGHDLGPVPKPLLLTALAGCTGMDVAAILLKRKVPFDTLRLDIEGDLTERPPITYSAIRIIYTLTAPAESQEQAIAAVQRSFNQLCGVAYLLKQVVPIDYNVIFNAATVFVGQSKPIIQGASAPA